MDEPPTPPDGGDAGEPEPVVRDPKAAKKLAAGAAKFVKNGDKLARRKKDAEALAEYERALAAYDKSFELHPDARILLVTAGLVAKMGRWVDAADRYERALAATEIPLDAKSQAKAQAGLDDARTHVGVVVMTVSPEGALVTLEGVEIGTAPLGKPLVLAPGEYKLVVTAPEFIDLETKLVVEAGSESERNFELQPIPVVLEPPRPPPPPPPPPLPPPPSKLPLYIGGGATVLFTGLAVTTGVMALGKHGTFTDPGATADEKDAAQSSGRTLTKLTDAFSVVALAGAGFTVYYYLKIYRPKAAERTRLEDEREGAHDEFSRRRRGRRGPKVVVVPSVQGDGGGLVLTGWF
jgi:tetratricopeptide (TPR) repeat protein